MQSSFSSIVITVLLAWLALKAWNLFYNAFLHPLKQIPGPTGARLTTWWKTYIEVFRRDSMTAVLESLHEKYGSVVRTGPNELHFADPNAYHDIYNTSARWDKEETLYHCFGEDRSSFGFLTYEEAKQRKDVLQPLFSRRAIISMQGLMNYFADVLTRRHELGKSSDLFFGFRCFTMDIITNFCFAKSIDAINAPDFKAPIIEAMEASLPTFVLLKHFSWFRKIIFGLPPWLAVKASPKTAGLTNLQVILGKEVKEVSANPEILKRTPHSTIYHRLLDPDAQNGQPIPEPESLYEEAQAMMFAGADTVGNTLMIGFFHIADQLELQKRLREEVISAWPNMQEPPDYQEFEKLSLLTAAIKESLRLSFGVATPLPRIVPAEGAKIAGHHVPGGTIVGISSVFVHYSPELFPQPEMFSIDRWLKDSKLDAWQVAFSRGPRSCLGMNLAWCELYVAFATMLRRFEITLDGTTKADLVWRDAFMPWFYGKHLTAWCKPIVD